MGKKVIGHYQLLVVGESGEQINEHFTCRIWKSTMRLDFDMDCVQTMWFHWLTAYDRFDGWAI